MRTCTVVLALILLWIVPLHAQDRVERPLQLQVNAAGVFLAIAGNALADPSVDEFKVNDWKFGASVGYHINRQFYAGYSLYPSLDLTLEEAWGFTNQVNDGFIELDHLTKPTHNFEVRYTPFNFGLYVSAALAVLGKVDYTMDFDRTGNTVLLGNSAYETDLNVTWNSKQTTTFAAGLGFNHVAPSGFSFNLGLSVPFTEPALESIAIRPLNLDALPIAPADLEAAREQLRNETFYLPVVFFFSAGFNISLRR